MRLYNHRNMKYCFGDNSSKGNLIFVGGHAALAALDYLYQEGVQGCVKVVDTDYDIVMNEVAAKYLHLYYMVVSSCEPFPGRDCDVIVAPYLRAKELHYLYPNCRILAYAQDLHEMKKDMDIAPLFEVSPLRASLIDETNRISLATELACKQYSFAVGDLTAYEDLKNAVNVDSLRLFAEQRTAEVQLPGENYTHKMFVDFTNKQLMCLCTTTNSEICSAEFDETDAYEYKVTKWDAPRAINLGEECRRWLYYIGEKLKKTAEGPCGRISFTEDGEEILAAENVETYYHVSNPELLTVICDHTPFKLNFCGSKIIVLSMTRTILGYVDPDKEEQRDLLQWCIDRLYDCSANSTTTLHEVVELLREGDENFFTILKGDTLICDASVYSTNMTLEVTYSISTEDVSISLLNYQPISQDTLNLLRNEARALAKRMLRIVQLQEVAQ